MKTEYRKLTRREKLILENLVTLNFDGAPTLHAQLDNALVRDFDDSDNYGSIEIKTETQGNGVTINRVPAEARAYDTDGVAIDVLLHVVNGKLSELEFVKVDGSQIITEPVPEDFIYRVR